MPARTRYIDNPLPTNATQRILVNDAARYARANDFLILLRKHQRNITADEYYDLRKQALDGDPEGAKLRLKELLEGGWF